MTRRNWQRGEGKAGCIFWGLILAIVGLTAYRFVPAKITDVEFRDYLTEMPQLYIKPDARFYEKQILNRADEMRIPLDKKNVKVKKDSRRVRIQVEYTRQLDFFVYTYEWHIKHDIERDIFRIN